MKRFNWLKIPFNKYWKSEPVYHLPAIKNELPGSRLVYEIIADKEVLLHGNGLPLVIMPGFNVQRAGNVNRIQVDVVRSTIRINGIGFRIFPENIKGRTAVFVKRIVGLLAWGKKCQDEKCESADMQNGPDHDCPKIGKLVAGEFWCRNLCYRNLWYRVQGTGYWVLGAGCSGWDPLGHYNFARSPSSV